MKPVRPTEPLVEFGKRIRELRQACGLTQQAVADRLQIHRTTYTKYEVGGVTPDQQGLVRMAEIFGVSVDHLLGHQKDIANVEAPDMCLSTDERELVEMFRQLSATQQQEVVRRVRAAFIKE